MFTVCIHILAWLAPLQINPGAGPGQACPGSGDCCQDNGTPGCQSVACCNTVCTLDPNCCTIGWSSDCVTLAAQLCGNLCAASVCPGTGDCCTSHASAACNHAGCCAEVCGVDESCCRDTWSADCVNLAEALCDPLCDAGPGCPGNGNCCFANGSPGCDDIGCCSTVCALDSFCCNGKWDDLCARKANDVCGGGQGSFCDWCPSEGSCCDGRDTPGCERKACCELVCTDIGSRCCTEFWDSGCALAAAQLCTATVCACPFFGEMNDIGSVDLLDAAAFFNCFTGSGGGPIDSECACADDDGDGDADLTDFVNFAPFFVSE